MKVFDVVRKRQIVNKTGEKVIWDKVGVMLVDGDKISICLNAVPVGWDGWLRAFPRQDGARAKPSQQVQHVTTSGGDALDDLDIDLDVPF